MERKRKRKKNNNHERLFLCLLADKQTRDLARDIRREFKNFEYKLDFTKLENLHLTIKFLGAKVSRTSKMKIIEYLNKISYNFDPVDIYITGVRFGFPGQSKPQVVSIDVDESPELRELNRKLNDSLKKLGLSDVIRKLDQFTPHVTVARVRKDISKSTISKVQASLEVMDIPNANFKAKELYLIKSELTKRKPVYTILERFPISK